MYKVHTIIGIKFYYIEVTSVRDISVVYSPIKIKKTYLTKTRFS